MQESSEHDHQHEQGHHHHGEHGGHEHHHEISADADGRYLSIALGLIVAFMIAEAVIGFIASSLALISDAGHMLTDAGSLILAIVAMRLARRPAHGIMTYGLKRTEILSAQINGTTLLVLAAVFIYEGIHRLIEPPRVKAEYVMIVGLIGIVVNLLATMSLARANRSSLNIRGSFQHILTDLIAFIATSIAGGIMFFTHSVYRLDAVAALLVAAIMAWSGYGLVRDAFRVLLEAAPKGMQPEAIRAALLADPDVVEINDFHLWEITSGFPALSAHILVSGGIDCHAKRRELAERLHRDYQIEHNTLQIDHVGHGEGSPESSQSETSLCDRDAPGDGA